jgi:hypothetical protein
VRLRALSCHFWKILVFFIWVGNPLQYTIWVDNPL